MFIVLEIQEATYGGTPSTLVFVEEDKDHAMSKWHEILKYAAVSSLYRHSAVVLTTEGKIVATESYVHTQRSDE